MAYTVANDYTLMEALVDPQVLAAMLDPVLEGKFKFLDLMEIDYTLQGQPGTVITVPQYGYIGPAEVVPEADLIPISKLVTDMVTFTIEKLGKGVILTDEDLNRAYGKPREQAIGQIATAIADAINTKVHNHLKAIPVEMTVDVEALNGDAIVDALVLFGEDEDFVDGDNANKYLFVSPLDLAKIRKDAGFMPYTETAMRTYKTGDLGTIWGTHVRTSNLLNEGEIYLAKKGFVTLHMKQNSMIEVGRIQERASWLITGTQHAGTNVTHVGRAIKITVTPTP